MSPLPKGLGYSHLVTHLSFHLVGIKNPFHTAFFIAATGILVASDATDGGEGSGGIATTVAGIAQTAANTAAYADTNGLGLKVGAVVDVGQVQLTAGVKVVASLMAVMPIGRSFPLALVSQIRLTC